VTATPIPDLIDNVLALYGRKFQLIGVKITTKYETHEPSPVVAGEMRQVFSNLIVNAADALSTSGDNLVIHVRNSVNWKTMERGVRVLVCDDGPGIPPKVRNHLFELFQTTKGEKGTGIGLWASMGIVDAHGGTLKCRSSATPGRSGTVFSVFVPTERSTSASEASAMSR
jgi:two-component system NtrC family sensor kinase